jgi:hypothetical protein
VDPSGYCSFGCFWQPRRHHDAIARGVFSSIRRLPGQEAIDRYMLSHPWAYSIGMAAAGFFGGPGATAAISGYAAYVQTGGDMNAARRAGLVSAATSAAFYAVGSALPVDGSYASVLGNAAGHAVVGCAAAVANDGSCRAGAMSAGFSAWAGGTFNSANNLAAQMVIGGVASRLGGGTFANGALTAAYGYLFNCLAHGCNMKSEGYEATNYKNEGIRCNGAVDPSCRFPGAPGIDNFEGQLSATASATAMWGFTGRSTETGYGMDSSGQFCRLSSECNLYGLGAGAMGELSVQVAGGRLSNGWQASVFGAAAVPLGGGDLSMGLGSDGGVLQFGRSRGWFGGVGIKVCGQVVSACTIGK